MSRVAGSALRLNARELRRHGTPSASRRFSGGWTQRRQRRGHGGTRASGSGACSCVCCCSTYWTTRTRSAGGRPAACRESTSDMSGCHCLGVDWQACSRACCCPARSLVLRRHIYARPFHAHHRSFVLLMLSAAANVSGLCIAQGGGAGLWQDHGGCSVRRGHGDVREALVADQARRAMAAAGVPRCRYHGTAHGLSPTVSHV